MGAISDCVSLKGGQNAMIHLHFTAAHSLWGWSFQGFYKAFDNIVKCAILTRFQWVTKSVKSKFSRKGLWKIYDAWSECHLLQILPRVQPSLADRDTLLVCQFFIYFGSNMSSKSGHIFKFNKTGFHVFNLNDFTPVLGYFFFPIPTLAASISLLTFQTWGGSCFNKARKLDDISRDMSLIWTTRWREVSPSDIIWISFDVLMAAESCFDNPSDVLWLEDSD